MKISLVLCLASFVILLAMLRRNRVTLGLPAAYLMNLLVLHVPGMFGQIVDTQNVVQGDAATRLGSILTAIGVVAFVLGVYLGTRNQPIPVARGAPRSVFWRFCLVGGGLLTVVAYRISLPSITAVIKTGGPIWMLGTMLGLRSAYLARDGKKMFRWLIVLAIYPLLILLLTGFMSYGSVAVIIVLSGLAVVVRSARALTFTYIVSVVFGISAFLSYFGHRDEIRGSVWRGDATQVRINATLDAIKDIELFNPSNEEHLDALDQRLNQNFFVGLAAARINAGEVKYLYGRSLYEGFLALIPRALWPNKPVEAGSPKIVSEMTGLKLAEGTSFGVGNVMEFHINFGIPGLIIGFVLFGFILARLDRKAAYADTQGDMGNTFLYFVPAIAMIQPNGSIVEIMGGAAAATAAGFGWRWAWRNWPKPYVRAPIAQRPRPTPQAL
jgi:hypothetical protein